MDQRFRLTLPVCSAKRLGMIQHNVIVVDSVPVTDTPPKPRPQCCEDGPVWWEDKALGGQGQHQVGWTGVANVSIPARWYLLYNPNFCPMCGTKLPEKP
jgi:hypothetical protein